MNKLIDLTGKRYGKLTVIKRAEKNHVSPCGTVSVIWVCQCDCGNIVLVLGKNLRSGKSTNCGCIRKINLPKSRRTHGDSRNCRLYRIYHNMINRCKVLTQKIIIVMEVEEYLFAMSGLIVTRSSEIGPSLMDMLII